MADSPAPANPEAAVHNLAAAVASDSRRAGAEAAVHTAVDTAPAAGNTAQRALLRHTGNCSGYHPGRFSGTLDNFS